MVKFLRNPLALRYDQIERVLLSFGFEMASMKGSHMKWRHKNLEGNIVIPVHHNNCKKVYKIVIAKIIKEKFL